MQQITRKNVKALYDAVSASCGWRKKITTILSEQQFTDSINVTDELIQQAYSEADAKQKELLRQFFTLPQSICDRINSIEDIYKILGIVRNLPYPNPQNKFERHLNAAYDIPHITGAYNGNKVLDFSNTSQPKYYLYWVKRSGAWVLYDVGYNHYTTDLGFGCYFAERDHATDASDKFKQTWLDYLPE